MCWHRTARVRTPRPRRSATIRKNPPRYRRLVSESARVYSPSTADSTRSSTKPMARPTRVMAKQVTATSAISGPTEAISARGSADAVVVIARAFWAFTAGAANWAFTDLRRRTERARERKASVVSRFAETTVATRKRETAKWLGPSEERDDKGRFELGGPRGGGTHTRAERFLPAGATARVELRSEGGWGRTVSQTRARSDAGRASAPCFAGARSG